MSTTGPAVHCQLLPLQGEQLLLPNTVIAEIIRFGELAPVDGAPPWLLGRIEWRDQVIAVVSFEAACKEAVAETGRRTKIVVLNAPGDNAQLDFFGVVVQGMPQLLRVREDNIAMIEHETDLHPFIRCHVIVGGETAAIPDMDVLEEKLLASA